MGEGAVVIELGDVAPAGVPDDILPAPGVDARRRRWRWPAIALIALPCLGLSAAAPGLPEMRGGFTVAQTRAWYAVDRSVVYLPTAEREVVAYDLDDGHLLWRTTLPHEVNYLQTAGGPVAVRERGECSSLSRLDPVTGRVMWTREGMWVGGGESIDGADRLLRSAADCTEGNIPVGPAGAIVLEVVDRGSGAVRLSVPLPEEGQWTFGPHESTLATWDERGHLVERDLTTGDVLVRGVIPELADAHGVLRTMTAQLFAVDNAWVVLDPPSMIVDDTEVIVSAYGRRALDPLWTVTLPGASPDVHQFYGMWQCETGVICVTLGENREVRLDAATGTRLPGGDQEALYGAHWSIAFEPTGIQGEAAMVLRDNRTGRIAFPGWRMQNSDRDDPLVAVFTRTVGAATEFALFDAHVGRLRVIGHAPGAYGGCELMARRMLCVDDRLALHVWPVPK